MICHKCTNKIYNSCICGIFLWNKCKSLIYSLNLQIETNNLAMRNVLLTLIFSITLVLGSSSFIENRKQSNSDHNLNIYPEKEIYSAIPAPPDTVPTLKVVGDDNKKVTLRMNELIIQVEVLGNIARTTMEMNFENKTDRILEGELDFPLGENQTVTRFALEINGKMREGVVVEKQKGQQVFEAVVRKNIDPGLLEKTKGNNFKARIYPIPSNGNKRIIIAYEQELIGTKTGNLYLLPLQFKDKMDKFSLKVEVFKQKVKPILENNELVNFEFTEWKDSYIAKQEYTNYIANKQLGFVLPETKNIYSTFIEKSDKQINDDYFYINLKPEKFTQNKKLPKSICLLYDVSTSSENKDTLKEIEVLDKYFKKISNLKVNLVTFSNEINSNTNFIVKDGNWEQLKKQFLNPGYDGATQFGSLDLSKYICDEFILISDGISNFGKSEILTQTTPVMVISSTQSADFSYLKFIASGTGGLYINLKNTTTEQALTQLTEQSYHFISAEYDKTVISELFPSKPTDFKTNFSIAGQLKSNSAEITLNFGFGNKVYKSIKVELDKSEIFSETNLVQRIWAQKKIAELDMLYEKNKEEIINLGKKYSIVTRNTSLIVLDRLEDYIQYEIVPPVELQKEYFEIIENKKKEKTDLETAHIEQVVQYFNARVEWWNTKFSKEKQTTQNDVNFVAPSIVDSLVMEESELSTSDEVASENLAKEEEVMIEDVGGSLGPVRENNLNETKNKDKEEEEGRISTIQLNAWDPETPYMTKIKNAKAENQYNQYLEDKKEYASTPSFYLDVANYFVKQGNKKLALRILSNIAEMNVQNHELMRILAHRLEQLEYYDLAISVYEEVVKIRTEEPQSYRDLSLCLAADGQYQKALDILYDAIKKPWDGRFPEIEGIMAIEMNRIISKAGNKIEISKIDKRLIKDMPVDVRIVLNWDTNNSDMDLWVTDPYGEKCYYSHALTYTGGRISRDFTQGYGPEEYLIKGALPGKYIIQANYYGSSSQRITGPTTIYLELYTNYGKKNEKKETITMQLTSEARVVDIGVLGFGK